MGLDVSGVVLNPQSKEVKKVVILFHGYGANGNDLFPLAQFFSSLSPDTLFLIPNGIASCEIFSTNYQWFSLMGCHLNSLIDLEKNAAYLADKGDEVNLAIEFVHNLIKKTMEHYSISESQVVLAGFSQGAFLAMVAASTFPLCLGGVISFSGACIWDKTLEARIQNTPPVLLMHGKQDQLVAPHSFHATKDLLIKKGFDVSAHMFDDLAHGINQEEMNLAGRFLKNIFDDQHYESCA